MKNAIRKAKVIDAVSMAASIISSPSSIQFLDNVCYQAVWSAGATPVGVLSVQVSVDYEPEKNISGNWDTVILPITPAVSGNSGTYTIDLTQLAAPWCRLVYTRTSGTGTLNAFMSAKEV